MIDGNPLESEAVLESLFAILETRVSALIEFGSLDVVNQLRSTFGALIDHLTDGVLAHDSHRRIFVFNRAAEMITGYSVDEVIGKDCHAVFPGMFCGGNCSFCDGTLESEEKIKYPKRFRDKNEKLLDLEMSAIPLHTADQRYLGAMVIFKDVTEVNRLKRNLQRSKGFYGIIGNHDSMHRVFNSISELADEQVPVLIEGESGTGKELVAEALHRLSVRSKNPFVPVNCGALPEGILESELFGHVKGAFTGAIRDKKGRFELAQHGTLFLDEIGEISPAMQVKLLRVIEEHTYFPVGGEKEVKTDARVVCATNRNLKQLVKEGKFREDLYYRLAVVPIHLPPLRSRKSDIPLLVQHFMEQFASETDRHCEGIRSEVMQQLMQNSWHGNVRQLSNALQYAMIKCRGGEITLDHLPPELNIDSAENNETKTGRPQKLERDDVLTALRQTDGNRAKAARLLGVARSTLYRYLEQAEIV
ncbi:sigma 54-interacting transcriptional regulator [bacterium]|nr:sigma 54-interacting transcriptional regulator [bacterium]